ncbi:hypothetical protein [Alteribacillus sp. HJP-4]
MDPLTLIILIIMGIFLFPLIMRGVGCVFRIIAIAVIIIGVLFLLGIIF